MEIVRTLEAGLEVLEPSLTAVDIHQRLKNCANAPLSPLREKNFSYIFVIEMNIYLLL